MSGSLRTFRPFAADAKFCSHSRQVRSGGRNADRCGRNAATAAFWDSGHSTGFCVWAPGRKFGISSPLHAAGQPDHNARERKDRRKSPARMARSSRRWRPCSHPAAGRPWASTKSLTPVLFSPPPNLTEPVVGDDRGAPGATHCPMNPCGVVENPWFCSKFTNWPFMMKRKRLIRVGSSSC